MNLQQLIDMREELNKNMFSGIKSMKMHGREEVYQSFEEMRRARNKLDAEIKALQGNRRIYACKVTVCR